MAPHRNHVEARSSRKPARQFVSETHDRKPDVHSADAPPNFFTGTKFSVDQLAIDHEVLRARLKSLRLAHEQQDVVDEIALIIYRALPQVGKDALTNAYERGRYEGVMECKGNLNRAILASWLVTAVSHAVDASYQYKSAGSPPPSPSPREAT